jgi:ornithine--oxo-acid transaminase
VLLICDEIQTGMGRTGTFLACQHDNVKPDGVILGKALGGGLLPVSAFVGTENMMQVFSPGDHGSTFGGNPLAAAVGLAALDVLFDEELIERSAEMGAHLLERLRTIKSPLVKDVRGKGLFVGLEVDSERLTARDVVDRLLARGILSKDTHGTVVRFTASYRPRGARWAVEYAPCSRNWRRAEGGVTTRAASGVLGERPPAWAGP